MSGSLQPCGLQHTRSPCPSPTPAVYSNLCPWSRWCLSVFIYIYSYSYMNMKASLVAQTVKNLPAMQKTWVWSLGWEDLLEEGMVTHSSILVWRIPWQKSQVGYSPWDLKESDMTEWLTHTHTHTHTCVCVYIYVHMYIHVHMYICVCVYIYIYKAVWNPIQGIWNLRFSLCHSGSL